MKKKNKSNAWFTLNASYFPPVACLPGKLMDDANLFLTGAHGIIRSLADSLHEEASFDPDDLANALWAASALIEMGQGSAREEYARMRRALKRGGDAG
jgi:hypothetical protein